MRTTQASNPQPAPSTSSSSSAAVVLEAVRKAYPAVEALRPVSLSVRQGETVALLGPSGSGKTTLLSLMAGEIEPTSGLVRLNGFDLARTRPGCELARQVGMVHQQFDLVPNLSALQNVLAGRLGQWGLARSLLSLVWPRDRQAALAALERVGVVERARQRAGRLSGGEQQRVAIARLFLQDPLVILADEPVASLDPARATEILENLVESARSAGKTLIASMHAVDLARTHFARLIGLRNGAIQFDLPAKRVTDPMLTKLYALRGLRAEA